MYKNIFYFRSINKIGGTEQFLYEIAKKYSKYDITIFYDKIDGSQFKRLSRYVKLKKRVPGEKIVCEKAFYNYNIEIIKDVEAKEHVFVCHAIYQVLGIKPPIDHPKLTRFIAVSNYAAKMLKEYAKKMGMNIEVETCYNPLTLEKVNKPKIIVAACRLNDRVKGGERTVKLVEALDRHCGRHPEDHYLMLIFTNSVKMPIHSPNVVLMQPRVDVRPYISMADYVLQLSDDMETYCYTTNEATGYGVPIVITPLSVYNELPITDNEKIVLDWDCKNIDDVIKEIFNKKVKKFEYDIPEDNWENLLDHTKATYTPEELVDAKAIRSYKDMDFDKYIVKNQLLPEPITKDRAMYLKSLGLIEIVE